MSDGGWRPSSVGGTDWRFLALSVERVLGRRQSG